jgi:hypothetical protein
MISQSGHHTVALAVEQPGDADARVTGERQLDLRRVDRDPAARGVVDEDRLRVPEMARQRLAVAGRDRRPVEDDSERVAVGAARAAEHPRHPHLDLRRPTHPPQRPFRSRCGHPGQQHGRRMPCSSSSRVLRMRRSRVGSRFASSTQQMNSLRASGVMSIQAAIATVLVASASRRSPGSGCTVPPGVGPPPAVPLSLRRLAPATAVLSAGSGGGR